MCGIAGLVSLDGSPVRGDDLLAMLGAQAHRGPDDESTWTNAVGTVALGQRRLAVLDLDPRARCPIASEDGRVVVTFNGEIYNFRELRAELLAQGRALRTEGDSEVIAHLVERDGAEAVHRLRGMFAFAAWDARTSTLTLVRDRLGKKPLHWTSDGRVLAFASEMQALLKLPWVRRVADLQALDSYLALQYVPAPATALRDVRRLAAGSLATVREGRVTVQPWWAPSYEPKLEIGEDEAASELRRRLDEAVRLRLVSDVPVGAFLSGGIDSAAVVASMARQSSRPVRTFTIGFEEADWSEVVPARRMAAALGCEHHEEIVRPDAAALLEAIVAHHGEPFADPSSLPTFLVAQLARRHVTVVLTGDGGDESFAGYERYVADRLARAWRTLPAPLRRAALAAARRLPHRTARRSVLRRGRRFLEAAERTGPGARGRARSWLAWHQYFSDEQRDALWAGEVRARIDVAATEAWMASLLQSTDARDPLDAVLSADLRSYLPDDLMVKTDIATMAASLEARAPLLDHELVQWSARLPASFKLRGRTTKWLLKRAHEGVLPRDVLTRPKSGFGVPLERWLRHELRERTRDALLGPDAGTRELLSRARVSRLIEEHESARADHSYRLWALLVLEEWMRQVRPELPA